MKKDQILKIAVETILIFLSVALAFWTEDYRSNKVERQNYLNTLVVFRNEVHETVRRFRTTYDTSLTKYRKNDQIPPLLEYESKLKQIQVHLHDVDKVNDLPALESLLSFTEWTDWRHATSLTEQFNNYPTYVVQDTIFSLTSEYTLIMNSEFEAFREFNKRHYDLGEILINSTELNDKSKVLNKLLQDQRLMGKLKNLSLILHALAEASIESDHNKADRLIYLTKRLDNVLERHGIDISKLDKQYLK